TANLALQDVDVRSLTDAELIAHARAVLDRMYVTFEQHFWLHGFDLGPIGLLLLSCQEHGVPPSDVVPLLQGASPSTTAPLAALARIRAAVDAAGADPASVTELRAISPAVADDVDTYLRYRGMLLFSRYDLDGVTLDERPDLMLATVMGSQERVEGRAIADR